MNGVLACQLGLCRNTYLLLINIIVRHLWPIKLLHLRVIMKVIACTLQHILWQCRITPDDNFVSFECGACVLQRSTISGSALVIDIDILDTLDYVTTKVSMISMTEKNCQFPWTVPGCALDRCSDNPTFLWSIMSVIALVWVQQLILNSPHWY